MSGHRILVYWDACVFLSWLKGEEDRRTPSEKEELVACARLVDRGTVHLVTSTITRVEVLASTLSDEQEAKFVEFLRSTKITLQAPDIRIVTLASQLRDNYQKQKLKFDRTICTPDAIHLATAIVYNVDEFQTFDKKDKGKCLGLLPLDGDVAGHPLKVCPPTVRNLDALLKPKKRVDEKVQELDDGQRSIWELDEDEVPG